MIKYGFSFLAVLGFVFIYSCTKDHTTAPKQYVCTGTYKDTVNSYNNNVKSILDFYCAYMGCHDAGSASSSGNIDLSTYDNAKAVFSTKNVICDITHTGCIDMPQGQPKLADSLILYFQCWQQNGYPQ